MTSYYQGEDVEDLEELKRRLISLKKAPFHQKVPAAEEAIENAVRVFDKFYLLLDQMALAQLAAQLRIRELEERAGDGGKI